MGQKWTTQMMLQKTDDAIKECEEIVKSTKNDKLKLEAAWSRALGTYRKNMPKNGEAAIPAIEEFLVLAPKDKRGPSLLSASVANSTDKDKKIAVEERILKDFPDSPTALTIKGQRRLREAIGKPFELEFTEAITDKTISMKDLKGKVVVVDFWATWCGPCVAEMPNMKKLYAEYKDKGVEFVGVSLDQPKESGGLDKLKEFVAKNEITWPQYYQGKGWESEFSAGWGINGIPCVFIVDANGNLFSTEARGQLEKMIPELLKKAKGDANAGGGQ
jgi:thiol-disulfide isomerase/thioredoxin